MTNRIFFQWYIQLFVALLFSTLFSACASSEDVGARFGVKPSAYGKPSEVVVVADKQLWEGAVGDTFRYYYSSAFLILPQPEPILDLIHFTPQQLAEEPVRKELRTYVILGNLADESSPSTKLITQDIGAENIRLLRENKNKNTKVGHDRWARGQMVIYQYALSESQLIDNLKANYPSIVKRIREFDQKSITKTAYQAGENTALMNQVKEKVDVEVKIPGDYFLALYDSTNQTFWMRKETDYLSSNILMRKLKYTNEQQLTKEGILKLRNEMGRRYISSSAEATFMRTNDVDLPVFTKAMEINNLYALEARGIWDIVNDFMGGPFISYMIHDPQTNDLLFIDAFVFAPGKSKRKYMQHLETIVATVKM
jgi:hypothetical protein